MDLYPEINNDRRKLVDAINATLLRNQPRKLELRDIGIIRSRMMQRRPEADARFLTVSLEGRLPLDVTAEYWHVWVEDFIDYGWPDHIVRRAARAATDDLVGSIYLLVLELAEKSRHHREIVRLLFDDWDTLGIDFESDRYFADVLIPINQLIGRYGAEVALGMLREVPHEERVAEEAGRQRP